MANRTNTYHVRAWPLADPATGLLLNAHPLHALVNGLSPTANVEFAKSDARVLIIGSHLLPFLDLGDASFPDGFLGVRDRRVRRHVSDLDERYWDQARTAQPPDRLCHEPFRVGLGDDDDGVARLGLQLISPLSVEVVHDDTVNHSSRLPSRLGAALAGSRWSRHRGRLAVAGVMVGVFGGPCTVWLGLAAVALVAPERLEEADGDQAAGVR